VRQLCARYPPEYWRDLDAKQGYPEEFVDAPTKSGWLSVLIPTEYGGSDLAIGEASVMLEEVNRNVAIRVAIAARNPGPDQISNMLSITAIS
jgi:acyl-CoA dehydrogenase